MKKCPFCVILPIVAMLIIVSCQPTPNPLDPVSIQNTAVAMVWTGIAQTQVVDIVSTVNAQGTQSAILSKPTSTEIMPPHEEPAEQSNPNFILELGYCRNDVDISGNPRDLQGCTIDKTYNVYIDPQIDWSVERGGMQGVDSPSQQEFCSLYQLDGVYIMSDIDITDGVFSCHP